MLSGGGGIFKSGRGLSWVMLKKEMEREREGQKKKTGG